MGWKCEVQDIFCKQHYFSFIGKLVEGSVFSVFFFLWKHIPSLTKNLIYPLKIDGWKTDPFLLGPGLLAGANCGFQGA